MGQTSPGKAGLPAKLLGRQLRKVEIAELQISYRSLVADSNCSYNCTACEVSNICASNAVVSGHVELPISPEMLGELPKMPPELLVSVQDFSEFQLAVQAGVTWIDLKDPSRGSLGQPSGDLIRQVSVYCADFSTRTFKISLALGELAGLDLDQLVPEAVTFDFAKVALAGSREKLLVEQLRKLSHIMHRPDQLILVHYADYLSASAPTFSQVLELACELNCRYLLIDTYRKSAGNLFHWYDSQQLSELVRQAHSYNIAISLAGSLGMEDLPEAAKCEPEVLAVRGAACEIGHRTNTISGRRLARLVELASCGFQIPDSNDRSPSGLQLRAP